MSTALDIIFNEYLRPYQAEVLKDFSRKRLVLKARRIGMSWVCALDVVLTTSGIWEAIGAPVLTADYNVISKRADEAKQFIRYCSDWLDILGDDPLLSSYVATGARAVTHIEFSSSGRRIQSDTQSKGAGRGSTGHLLKDEAAHYKYARTIMSNADPIPLSDPRLRITEFSTPYGTSGMGEVFYEKWTDLDKFGDYSRHKVDIYRAIDDGFPITVEDARASQPNEELFRQEFECSFIGTGDAYFDLGMLQDAEGRPPGRAPDRTIVGIDVASVVDLTALVVLEQYGDLVYAGDTYLIASTPYASGPNVMGQEDIVHALLRHVNPDAGIMDATSDGAELFARVMGKEGVCPIQPHQFNRNGRAWKEAWVPRLRTAIEDGSFMFAPPQTYIYQSGQAESADDAANFVDVAFRETSGDALKADFTKVRKKLLQSGVTFDTERDQSGHGDAFWAACMGYTLTDNTARRRARPKRAPKQTNNAKLPHYLDYL